VPYNLKLSVTIVCNYSQITDYCFLFYAADFSAASSCAFSSSMTGAVSDLSKSNSVSICASSPERSSIICPCSKGLDSSDLAEESSAWREERLCLAVAKFSSSSRMKFSSLVREPSALSDTGIV